MNVICRFTALILTLAGLTVQAGDFNNSVSYKAGWLYINQDDGLVVNIPAQETYEVLNQAQSVKSGLLAQKNRSAEEVENTRFKTSDTIIAMIMPGGLIYAAHKKQKHHQAKEDLTTITTQLEGVKEGLDFLKIAYSKEILASR